VTVTLSLAEARRLAVAAQGFGARPAKPSIAHVRKLAARLHAFQIDSVNVLARAHYVPAFARLGPYPTTAVDQLAYQRRELFEYWGHAACLLPVALYPLVRYRMHTDEAREHLRSVRGASLARVYDEIGERGPLAASELSDPGTRSGNWWGWGDGKRALEYLYDSGLVAIAGRRRFERLYDLTERVIPQPARDAPVLPREDAMKELVCLGAAACGVGTSRDITDYLRVDGWRDRMPSGRHGERNGQPRARAVVKRLVRELVEDGRLEEVDVEGWSEVAYVVPGTRVPRTVDARALVTPFDSLVWERSRIARLFGMQYTIEIYLPAHKRVYGYYVFPFLLGDTLVGRCDLKADRARRVLMVQSAFSEPGQDARRVVAGLVDELRDVQRWLELDTIEIADRGDLAPKLRRAFRSPART
jgi:uncharacterized protein YcaQ